MESASSRTAPSTNHARQRIVITTWGSLGDLHPYVALALGLQSRGHDVILATGECYRRKIEALGLGFRPVRPDCDWVTDPVVMRRLTHPRWGIIRAVRMQLLSLRESYEDTLAAAEGADLLAGNMAAYVSGIVAEKITMPWASMMHLPTGFFSANFLDDGEPPLVFTLGTAVVADAGPFYHQSVAAAKLLGRRAVLLVKNPRIVLPELPEGVVAFDYAPFSQLFPRAAAIVHHGGIGTTGQAMRSGRPSLVMPCAWDQPDNAERAARLGIARTISRHRYEPQRVAAELRHLLEEPAYSQRAAEIATKVRQEDGVKTASDALESLIASPGNAQASPPRIR